MFDKWDQRFIDLANFVAAWSKDPSTQVGAVVANPLTKRVVSMGFNGFPTGVDDLEHRLENRDIKYEMIVHAETNALLFAGPAAEGCTLYVTLEPCSMCSGALVNTKCASVVYGARDLKAGACESLYQIPQDDRLNHRLTTLGGVMEGDSKSLLQEFFLRLRQKAKGSKPL